MEAQAEANASFYIDQVTRKISESLELTRDVAFNAIADGTLREAMQNTSSFLNSAGRDALQSSVGSTVAFQSIWGDRFLNGVYLFRDDGQSTSYTPYGSYVQEQRRMQRLYEETLDQSSARTFFCPENGAENKTYFIWTIKTSIRWITLAS